MHSRTLLVVAAAIGILAVCASTSQPPRQAVSLATLPSIWEQAYRVDPYIEAASQLHAMGREAAFKQLIMLARSPLAVGTKRMETQGGPEAFKEWTNLLHLTKSDLLEERQKIAVLCRMLFTRRAGSDFERPGLGSPAFLGERPRFILSTDDPIFRQWPLEPIEILDGVPFAVVTGYSYEGWVDPCGTEVYVRYCMTNCDWSSTRFRTKTKAQKEAGLRKLLSSPRWEEPLSAWEREYLTKQLE